MVNNDISIIIKGKLDEKKTEDLIKSQLDNIQNNLNITIGVNSDQVGEITKKIKELQLQVNKNAKNVKILDFEEVQNGKTKIFKDINDIKREFGKIGDLKFNNVLDPVTKDIKEIQVELQRVDGLIDKMTFSPVRLQDGNRFTDGLELTKLKEIDNREIQMANAREKANAKRIADEKKLSEAQAKASNKAIEDTQKEIQKQKELNAEIEREIQLYQRLKQAEVTKTKNRLGDRIDNHALDNQLNKVMSVDSTSLKSMSDVRKWQKDINVGFTEISANAKTAQTRVVGFGEQFSIAMQRFPINCRLLSRWE